MGWVRILGVDPGLQVTGYGVIAVSASAKERKIELVEAGVIRTLRDDGIAERLKRIYEGLSEAIQELKPDILAIEKLFAHYEHPTTAILMGHARGVVCLLSGTQRVPMVNIASTHVKKALTGHGHAGKHQVGRMVQSYLGLKTAPDPPDVSDALAVAIAYAFNFCFKSGKRL